jgi:hypothetical protein
LRAVKNESDLETGKHTGSRHYAAEKTVGKSWALASKWKRDDD